MVNKRGTYGVKQYDASLYTWSPERGVYNKNGNKEIHPTNKNFCNATSGSQGEDWFTTYDYNIIIASGSVQRIAYVACDYVQ